MTREAFRAGIMKRKKEEKEEGAVRLTMFCEHHTTPGLLIQMSKQSSYLLDEPMFYLGSFKTRSRTSPPVG